MNKKRRVLVLGLDCAAPELVFDRFAARLPTLTSPPQRGIHAELESVSPPITVPAWSCMMTGCAPGSLGIYGFRNRSGYDYEGYALANGEHVKLPTVWRLLSERGRRVVVFGVPQTY